MASSSCEPVGITWEYDRGELIVDGIVHVLGVSLGLVGAIAMVILTANRFARPIACPSVSTLSACSRC